MFMPEQHPSIMIPTSKVAMAMAKPLHIVSGDPYGDNIHIHEHVVAAHKMSSLKGLIW